MKRLWQHSLLLALALLPSTLLSLRRVREPTHAASLDTALTIRGDDLPPYILMDFDADMVGEGGDPSRYKKLPGPGQCRI